MHRVIGPVAAADCHLDRPVFADPELQREFDRAGYVVVDLLDAPSLERLRSTYFRARDSSTGVNPPGAYNDAYAEFSVIHSRPDFRREAFDVINEVTRPCADRLLVDYRPLVANFVNKPPGTGVVPAHQNWAVVDERRYQSVSVWIALSDCGVEDGAMWMAPGSHRRLRGPRGMWGLAAFVGIDPEDIESVLTPVPVRAGQAVLLDDAVVHYSPPNRGAEDRLAVQFVMVPSEAEAVFSTQVGGDERHLDVEVRVVEPAFFFDFWHGDGDDDHARIVDRIRVPVVSFTAADLAALADPAA
jgi:ectoine hydroxylase-related dioxygenase (phytanoyl-CoA dioxygenase family)